MKTIDKFQVNFRKGAKKYSDIHHKIISNPPYFTIMDFWAGKWEAGPTYFFFFQKRKTLEDYCTNPFFRNK